MRNWIIRGLCALFAVSSVGMILVGSSIQSARASDDDYKLLNPCSGIQSVKSGVGYKYNSLQADGVSAINTRSDAGKLTHTFTYKSKSPDGTAQGVAIAKRRGTNSSTVVEPFAYSSPQIVGKGGSTYEFSYTDDEAYVNGGFALVVAVTTGKTGGVDLCVVLDDRNITTSEESAANPLPPCPTDFVSDPAKSDNKQATLSWKFSWADKPATAVIYYLVKYIVPATGPTDPALTKFTDTNGSVQIPDTNNTQFVINSAYLTDKGAEVTSTGCTPMTVSGTTFRVGDIATPQKEKQYCGSMPGYTELVYNIKRSICEIALIGRNVVGGLLDGAVDMLGQVSGVPALQIGSAAGSTSSGTAPTGGIQQILQLIAPPGGVQNLIVQQPTATSGTTVSVIVQRLANVMQGLVNTFVLLLLIVAAFSNIFNTSIGTYGIKKLLPGVLIGFVIANFSVFIVRTGLEVVTVTANTVLNVNIFDGSVSPGGSVKKSLSAFSGRDSYLTVSGKEPTGSDAGSEADVGRMFNQHIMNMITLFAAVAVFILAFLFIARSIVLIALVPIAPIAFFGSVVSPLSFLWKSWSKNFIQWALMPVVVSFWIMLAAAISLAITTPTAVSVEAGALSSASLPALLVYLGVVFCLIQAIRTPFKVQGDLKVVMDKWGAAGKSVYNAGATGVKAVGARANAKILTQRAEKNAKITAGKEQLETIQAEKAKQNEKLKKADEDKKRLANKRSRMAEIRKELKNSSLTPEEKASLTDELNDLTSLSAGSIAKNEADATAAIAKETAKETKLQAELIKLKQEDNALKMKAMLSPSNAYAMTKTKIKNAVQSYVTDPAKKNDEILNQMAELDMSSNTGIYARGKAAQKNIDSALAASKKTNEYLLDDSAYRVDKEGAARRKQDTLNSTVIKTVQEDAEKAFTQGIYTDLAHQVAAKPGDFDEGYNKIARENTDKAMSAAVAGEASNLDKPIKNFKPLHEKALYGVLTKNPALKGRLDKVNGHDLIPQGKLTKEETSNDDYVKALGNAGRALRTLANMRDSKYVGAAETAAIQLDALAEKLYGPGFKGVEIKSKAEKGGGAVSPPEWVTYQEAVARYGVADTNDRGRISDAIGKSAVAQAINVANGQPLETIVYTNS